MPCKAMAHTTSSCSLSSFSHHYRWFRFYCPPSSNKFNNFKHTPSSNRFNDFEYTPSRNRFNDSEHTYNPGEIKVDAANRPHHGWSFGCSYSHMHHSLVDIVSSTKMARGPSFQWRYRHSTLSVDKSLLWYFTTSPAQQQRGITRWYKYRNGDQQKEPLPASHIQSGKPQWRL